MSCMVGQVWKTVRMCHKSVLLSVFVFVSIINLLSFSMFFEPTRIKVERFSSNRPAEHIERLDQSRMTLEVASSPASSTTVDHSESKVIDRAKKPPRKKALVAPRLDRMWPDVWTIKFPVDKSGICDDLSVTAKENWTSIVVVVSAPSNFEQRSSVRETWGRALQKMDNIRIVFLVGRFTIRNESTVQQSMLLKEIQLHSDLIQANFIDHYDNLTLKSVLMLRWVISHCPTAHFLFKVDDDVFVHPENLQRVLAHYSTQRRMILGHLARHWRPIRDHHSHYYVSTKTWTAGEYPDFVAGPAYVITMDSVASLLDRVRFVPYFHLEDVYVTGMLAQAAAVQCFNQPGFYNRKLIINPCEQRGAVTSHHFDPDELRAAWDVHLGGARAGTSDSEYDKDGCYETKCKALIFGLCLFETKVPIDYYHLYYGERRRQVTHQESH